ncbi:MAG: 4Fe-4S binding protein [Bacteroidales bacterium]|nr:4Fe-4S binding protein [Bacteroidales bacterium]
MNKVKLEESRCPQNHYCPVMNACPSGAISQKSPFEAPVIDQEKCTDCGKCTRYCPYGAFTMD